MDMAVLDRAPAKNVYPSLKSLSLIDYPERGFVRAEDWLFP